MIAANVFGNTAECCNGCGTDLQGKHVCYWERSRVCTACFEDLAEGERRIKSAERRAYDRQAMEDDDQMEALGYGEGNSLVSVLSAFALLVLLGLFWYLAVLGAVHAIGDLVDL